MTAFEALLARFARQEASAAEFLADLLDTPVFAPSGAVFDDRLNGFQPVILKRGGAGYAVVVSGQDALLPYRERAPYGVQRPARHLIAHLRADLGMVINPGRVGEIWLDPDRLQDLRVRAGLI